MAVGELISVSDITIDLIFYATEPPTATSGWKSPTSTTGYFGQLAVAFTYTPVLTAGRQFDGVSCEIAGRPGQGTGAR